MGWIQLYVVVSPRNMIIYMTENPLAMEVALLCHLCRRVITRVHICLLVPLAMRPLRRCEIFFFFFFF